MFHGSALLSVRTFVYLFLILSFICCSYLNRVKDPSHWQVTDALPSYGRGIDLPGKRYMSLINGDMLHDVVVTGYIHILFHSFHFVC